MTGGRLQGESFGQKPPPLTDYLHSLIREYPKGIGIVKEFVQNADDAGATSMKILVDWRSHPTNVIPDPRMAPLMGPALLFYNDARFTDEDLKGIEQLSRGSKGTDTGKTGRFGLGFNSAYNITDVPSFITGEHFYCFDPHGTNVLGASEQDPGQRWTLKALWDKASDLLVPFLPLGLKNNQSFCPHTIFRLPFRTDAQAVVSEISKEPFGHADITSIFETLEQLGAELLLFLRHLTSIEVYEIFEGSSQLQQRFAFRTRNGEEVQERRAQLEQRQKQNDIFALLKTSRKLSVTYKHVIDVESRYGHHKETWRIVNGLYCDRDGKLIEETKTLAANGEKVFPGAGAAALIRGRSQTKLQGSAYCFLPLPVSTQLPVHVHGYFDLDRSRQKLTDEAGLVGNDARRGRWNTLLIEHAVAAAYAELLIQLKTDVGDSDPAAFYTYWPTSDLAGPFSKLLPSLVEHLEGEPVVSTTALGRWRTFDETYLLKANWELLKPPLTAMDLAIVEPPLPRELTRALQQAGAFLEDLTPNKLRRELRINYDLNCPLAEVEQPWLQNRVWLCDLLKICLLNSSEGDLKGLPLALMADGKLRTFGSVKASNGRPVNIFLGGRKERTIFSSYASIFVDQDYAHETKLGEDPVSYLVAMTPAHVVGRLGWMLDAATLTQPRSWQPDGSELPNSAWLTDVYEYFEAHEKDWQHDTGLVTLLKKLPFVPDQFGALRFPGRVDTPLLPEDRESALEQALRYLDVPIVSADAPLKRAIEQFVNKIEGFIYQITPVDLVDTLGAVNFLGDAFESEVHGPILDFLSSHSAITELTENQKLDDLAELRIYPNSDGELVNLVEAEVFLSANRDLPPDFGGVHFLKEGPNARWRNLLSSLGVEELTESRIAELILPSYEKLNEATKLSSLTWLRDNMSVIERDANDLAVNSAQELRRQIARAPLVRCDDGKYRAIPKTYTPDVELPRKVLGSNAPLPDMEHYLVDRERWLSFFGQLGIAVSPRPEDLIVYLDTLLSQADKEGVRAVEASLAQFAKHVADDWSALAKASESFALQLSGRAWLPSRQSPGPDLPGFVVPEDRLYQPEEIYRVGLGSLVSSQAPILSFPISSGTMRNALGMLPSPNINTVLQHFNYLLELWPPTRPEDIEVRAFGKSMEDIYYFLGNPNDSAQIVQSLARHKYDSKPCLWDSKTEKLWPAHHTFKVKCDVFASRRLRLASSSPSVDRSYERLGRREEVETSDYIDYLLELLGEYKDTVLEDSDQVSVLKVLEHIRLEVTDTDRLNDVLLLTKAGKLVQADEAYLDDAPWFSLRLEGEGSDVSLVHEEINSDFALAVGVHRLSESIKEKLDGVPTPTDFDKAVQQCKEWQETICSPEFAQGVLRLVEYGGGDLSSADLRLFERITVKPTKQIRTTLWLESEMRTVGSGTTDVFFNPEDDKVFLAEPLLSKFLGDALNQALEGARLDNPSALIVMLDTRPDDISTMLDRFRIPRIKQAKDDKSVFVDGYEETEYGVYSSDHEENESGDTPQGNASEAAPRSANEGSENAAEKVREHARAPKQEHTSSSQSTPYSKTTSKSHEKSKPEAAPFVDGVRESTAPQSTSQSSGSEQRKTKNPGSGKRKTQERYRTYVYAEHETAGEHDSEEAGASTQAQQIGRAAEMKVMVFEEKNGRIPKHYGGNNEGFDIISTAADGSKRFIEVKGIDGPWGDRGVALTAPQYKKALEQGSSYWLYVVEYALDDGKELVTLIMDPASLVSRYVFDEGWKSIV